ncbi:conserved hypothetical protein [Verticillium alfalfae VaMs.102]|uniref:Ribosomal RNA-processing protein n=1 Tax=Verticillium alfalfae (strain VaMs.102 / ATCC MYA-4576 / FGSC 10136) TaxID=526221 RepID=C9SXY2_VERA1|nr:conserved hypothetical protein [Verticillium alfalfae VaMs.102]EEY23647.1 conserved hypothetical protein [Verticillium alfalfae VaMs.102]
MTDSSLQDRLRDHAKAFDGLLSLIPAKMYYGEDTSPWPPASQQPRSHPQDQWNRKKQTKAEAKAARMGKLDPDSDRNRNAKDVMEERAKNKRKLQEMEDAEQAALPQPETPGQGLRRRDLIANKKLKIDRDFEQDTLVGVSDANPADMTQDQLMKLAKRDGQKADRKAKQARQAEKKAKKLAAKEAAAAAAAAAAASQKATEELVEASEPVKTEPVKAETKKGTAAKKAKEQKPTSKIAAKPPSDDGYETVDSEAETGKPSFDMAGLEEKPASTASSQRSPSHSPVFDDAAAPASGSAGHVGRRAPSDKPKQLKIPQDTSALKAPTETWLTARRRAEGEKIRDDEATLKKTIKRKDKQKRKSEKEWKDRTEGVAHAKAEKQKKREANLKKRKDDKKLGKAGRKVVSAATKKKGRPGFEGGSFGGKKKK